MYPGSRLLAAGAARAPSAALRQAGDASARTAPGAGSRQGLGCGSGTARASRDDGKQASVYGIANPIPFNFPKCPVAFARVVVRLPFLSGGRSEAAAVLCGILIARRGRHARTSDGQCVDVARLVR